MLFFADIGELGWSLYLSAHVRWLVKEHKEVVVATSGARMCLYEGAATVPLPVNFGEKYRHFSQDGFGLYGVSCKELRQYFEQNAPVDYIIPSYFDFRCRRIAANQMIYAPYTPSPTAGQQSRILVFPRVRHTFYPRTDLKIKHPNHHGKRNLPCAFYKDLIAQLCTEFPGTEVTCVGTISGAYNIIDTGRFANYSNLVGTPGGLQDLINMCVSAQAAIGGTSAPPKISMLQGVPTVIIGHEKKRFVEEENWMKTRCMFWPIQLSEYNEFRSSKCIREIVEFIRRK